MPWRALARGGEGSSVGRGNSHERRWRVGLQLSLLATPSRPGLGVSRFAKPGRPSGDALSNVPRDAGRRGDGVGVGGAGGSESRRRCVLVTRQSPSRLRPLVFEPSLVVRPHEASDGVAGLSSPWLVLAVLSATLPRSHRGESPQHTDASCAAPPTAGSSTAAAATTAAPDR